MNQVWTETSFSFVMNPFGQIRTDLILELIYMAKYRKRECGGQQGSEPLSKIYTFLKIIIAYQNI